MADLQLERETTRISGIDFQFGHPDITLRDHPSPALEDTLTLSRAQLVQYRHANEQYQRFQFHQCLGPSIATVENDVSLSPTDWISSSAVCFDMLKASAIC